MNEQEAIKAIRRVKDSAIAVTIFFLLLPFIYYFAIPDQFKYVMYLAVPGMVMLTILNGLAMGIYTYNSRACASVLLLGTVLLLIVLLPICNSISLLVFVALLRTYQKGLVATYYFHTNKLAKYW